MSRRLPSSRDIDWLGGLEDGAAPNPVVAALDRTARDEINPPPQDRTQLFGHRGVLKQAPFGFGSERHEHVHIALGAEVVAQDRAEERELSDLPAAAKRFDRLSVYGNVRTHRLAIPMPT